eukprot:scaffold14518_cov67-Skeletonema_dohrnii-CCMP3373.AAC.2
MTAPQPNVTRNNYADHNHNDLVASRDDEETVAAAASTMTQWRGNTVPKKEAKAKAIRHVFDDLQDHFGHQRVDPRVHFNSTNLAPGSSRQQQNVV